MPNQSVKDSIDEAIVAMLLTIITGGAYWYTLTSNGVREELPQVFNLPDAPYAIVSAGAEKGDYDGSTVLGENGYRWISFYTTVDALPDATTARQWRNRMLADFQTLIGNNASLNNTCGVSWVSECIPFNKFEGSEDIYIGMKCRLSLQYKQDIKDPSLNLS